MSIEVFKFLFQKIKKIFEELKSLFLSFIKHTQLTPSTNKKINFKKLLWIHESFERSK
jgi:hypothetical protein